MAEIPESLKGLERYEQPCVRLGPDGGTIPLMPTDTGKFFKVEDVLATLQSGEAGEGLKTRIMRAVNASFYGDGFDVEFAEAVADLAVEVVEGREDFPDTPIRETAR